MPLGSKLSGEVGERKISKGENREKGYLTAKQGNYLNRKVESGSLINKSTDEAGDTDQDIELDKLDDTSGNENPYRELIVNNAGKIETTLSQMEQWLIL